ncbi:hypothetical protein H2199_009184 [Coniosporium tulheliwenetii]|uniref:Uncharacterized protein n=1 Tax=Coniosporium tulheliwenetii TaxID=3383036 RepID=A0ACC2YEY9_9PEZI|nr:hypothetical protein H2199_009184 [Cladosporium sp. JES 115]
MCDLASSQHMFSGLENEAQGPHELVKYFFIIIQYRPAGVMAPNFPSDQSPPLSQLPSALPSIDKKRKKKKPKPPDTKDASSASAADGASNEKKEEKSMQALLAEEDAAGTSTLENQALAARPAGEEKMRQKKPHAAPTKQPPSGRTKSAGASDWTSG